MGEGRLNHQGAKVHGDDANALAARFRLPLLRYFERRVSSREEAEELTHETFVRLLRRADIHMVGNLEGFVFVAAANLLKDHYRHRARQRAMWPIEGVELASEAPLASKVVEDRSDLNVLLAAIKELPPKCRAVFVMHRFDEIPHTEIAKRIGISTSMVEKHVATAMRHLRDKLIGERDD